MIHIIPASSTTGSQPARARTVRCSAVIAVLVLAMSLSGGVPAHDRLPCTGKGRWLLSKSTAKRSLSHETAPDMQAARSIYTL